MVTQGQLSRTWQQYRPSMLYLETLFTRSVNSTSNKVSTIPLTTTVLQWKCRCIQNKVTELSVRLRKKPIPALFLCEDALPGIESLQGYVKCRNPSLPKFPHRSAALYVAQSIPQCSVDTTPLSPVDCGSVSARLSLGKTSLIPATLHIQAQRQAVCSDVLECLHALI